jgi:hypothetical protein
VCPTSDQQVVLTVKQRSRLIRKATPNGDTLENLFEMQNRICDLCEFPIQDLILAALDHSTPVIRFARSGMPIADAIAQANDPKNLRCAHAACNRAKNGLTRKEWFARGLNERDTPRFLTDGELLELQFRIGAGGRKTVENGTGIFAPGMAAKNARMGGRKNVESGELARIRELPQSKQAQRKSGRIAGRKYGRKWVESGHLQRISRLGGFMSGQKNKKNRVGIFAPEHLGKGGRKTKENGTGIFGMTHEQHQAAGRKTREKGVGLFGMTPEQHRAAGQKGGLIGGRARAMGAARSASGQFQKIPRF